MPPSASNSSPSGHVPRPNLARHGLVHIQPAASRIDPQLVGETQAGSDDFHAVATLADHTDGGIAVVVAKGQAARLVPGAQRQPGVALLVRKQEVEGRLRNALRLGQPGLDAARLHQPPGAAARADVGDQESAVVQQGDAVGHEFVGRPVDHRRGRTRRAHPHHTAFAVAGIEAAVGQRDDGFGAVQVVADAGQCLSEQGHRCFAPPQPSTTLESATMRPQRSNSVPTKAW